MVALATTLRQSEPLTLSFWSIVAAISDAPAPTVNAVRWP
jgi:hypothetical protein